MCVCSKLALVWRNGQKGQMQMGAPRRARGELKGVGGGWWSWGLGTSHTKGKSEREEEGKEGSTSGTTKQMHERVIQYNTRWWTSGIRGMDRRPHNVEDPWKGRPHMSKTWGQTRFKVAGSVVGNRPSPL